MEAFFVLLALAFLSLPIVALVLAVVARGRAVRAEARLDELEMQLGALRNRMRVAQPPEAPVPVSVPAPAPAPAPETEPAGTVLETTAVPAAPATAVASPPPAPPAPPRVPAPAASEPKTSLEEKIALVWFARIGALVLLAGVGYFFKYAVDNDWIGPLGRVVLGAGAGAGLLVLAEFLAPRSKPVFVQALLGAGVAILFVTSYASHAFYHLVEVGPAFGAVAVVAVLGGALALRHRGEVVLLLSLAGAFLAPVLLNTGVDRPVGLFGYLLVTGIAASYAAMRADFRFVPWAALAGTLFIFAGWYAKFFDVHAPLAEAYADLPPEKLVGAYYELASRVGPLSMMAAFVLAHVGLFALAKRGAPQWKAAPLPLVLTALVLSHLGAGALLFDHPLHLGAALVLLGALSAAVLLAEKKVELLAIPAAAGFVALGGTVRAVAESDPTTMLAILGVWGVLHAAAFARGLWTAHQAPPPKTQAFLGGVGLAFLLLSGMLLARHHALSFAAVTVGVALAYAALSLFARSGVLLGLSAVASFLALCWASAEGDSPSHTLIALAGAWAAVHLAALGIELVVRRTPARPVHVVVLSGVSLGFLLLAFHHTEHSESVLRAALTALVGVVDMAFGYALAPSRRRATVLYGEALAAFAAAAGLLFDGSTITLVWAAMAGVVAVLAAQEKDPIWLGGALALFSAALIRVLGFDALTPLHEHSLYLSSLGKEGALRPTFLLNSRAYAFAGTAAALFIAARVTGRAGKGFKVAGAILAVIGHAVLLSLVALEARNLSLQTPVPDGLYDWSSAAAFATEWNAAVHAQAGRLAMIVTLVFGLYASALVAAGFAARSALHRWLGLALFGITLGKLAVWDIWHLPRVHQIAVLTGIGALLLAASYLYARKGARIVEILKGGAAGGTALLVLCLLPSPARAVDPSRFSALRPVEGVSAPGLYRVEVDADTFRASQAYPGSLSDLRIVGPDGREVPWLVREIAADAPVEVRTGTFVDPVELPDGSTRGVLDLGRPGLKHSEVTLSLGGDGFLRRTRVEVSQDEKEWALIADGGWVFRVATGAGIAERLVIRYPVSDARYLRVTVVPSGDRGKVPVLGLHAAFVQAAGRPPVRGLELAVAAATENREAKKSTFELDTGGGGLPVSALVLQTSSQGFERRAEVLASTHRTYWAPAGGGLLWRVAPPALAPALPSDENLRLDFAPTGKRYLRVDVHDGDLAALRIEAAWAEWRAREIVFRADAAGAHTLYVGAEGVPAPDYDLAAVLARAGPSAPIASAGLGPLSSQVPSAPAEGPLPFTERHGAALRAGLFTLVLALAFWAFVLMRRGGSAS